MKNLLPGLVLLMLLFACNEDSSDCGDPAPTNCELVLMDSLNTNNYILTLNKSDNDTLNIKISQHVSQCWTSYSIDSISYNHQLPDNVSANRYNIVK